MSWSHACCLTMISVWFDITSIFYFANRVVLNTKKEGLVGWVD
jgi:hypothetical protein